jgi:hypothetical protein
MWLPPGVEPDSERLVALTDLRRHRPRDRAAAQMKRSHPLLLAALASTLVLAPRTGGAFQSTSFVETFDGGSNEGGWTFGTGNESILSDGGNPGAYLRDTTLFSAHPRASTSFGVDSEFTGNWAARGVTSVGIDLATAAASGNISSSKLSLVILNDNGTPFDLGDDWGAYHVSDETVPQPGILGRGGDILGWVPYDFDVDSSARRLPAGWTWISRNSVRRSGSWARLMRDVSHVGFIYGDPARLQLFLNYDVALDNPRIAW